MVEKEEIEKKFNSFKEVEYSNNDIKNIIKKEKAIKNKAKKGPLKNSYENISLYFLMLRDTFSGKYKKIPKGSIAAIVGTLLYVFSPIDLVCDYFPFIGLIDDAAVLALCAKFVSYDVDNYKDNLKNNKEKIEKEYRE